MTNATSAMKKMKLSSSESPVAAFDAAAAAVGGPKSTVARSEATEVKSQLCRIRSEGWKGVC